MNPGVLRRFVIYMAIATVVMFTAWMLIQEGSERLPGDYETEIGQLRLEDEMYWEAMDHFNQALMEMPDHRGALMGRALVFIQTERYADAVAELDYLIDFLDRTLTAEDGTGRGVLAAAHANRGIVLDREGRYEEALESYIMALRTDEQTVEGPDIFYKVLFDPRPSTVRDRAQYIYEQLQLPEDQRLMRMPELDAEQRMYRP